MIDVTILLLHGGLASTALGPMDVFYSAGRFWNVWAAEPEDVRFRIAIASVDGEPVVSDGPVSVTPHCAVSDVRHADLIFIPSAGLDVDETLSRHGAVVPWLCQWHRRGAAIAGVCSGIPLIAEAGLLDGKAATTHWGTVEEYRARFPAVDWQPDRIMTEADGVYCGGGVYAALDLSLYLVERFCGRKVAVETAKALLLEMPRTYQSGFAVLPLGSDHRDEAIGRAQRWIHENFDTEFRIEDLAPRFGMSARNFIRRFRAATGEAPNGYVQKLRIAAAKRLLEDGVGTVQSVSSAVGYDDVAFFRTLFKRHAGVSPAAYRKSFGPARAA